MSFKVCIFLFLRKTEKNLLIPVWPYLWLASHYVRCRWYSFRLLSLHTSFSSCTDLYFLATVYVKRGHTFPQLLLCR